MSPSSPSLNVTLSYELTALSSYMGEKYASYVLSGFASLQTESRMDTYSYSG